MKIMVVGGGGREHAIIKKLKENKSVEKIYAVPGNGGMVNDAELVNISVDGIRKYLSMMPLIGVSMIGSNYFQSIGKAKQAMFLSLLRQVILLVPMMLVLPKFLGLNGVWFAQPIADITSFIVTLVLVLIEVKSHKAVEKNEIEIENISLEA